MKKIVAVLLLALLSTIPLWAQSPSSRGQATSDFSRSDSSRLHDEHSRESRGIGTIAFVPVEGGFDVKLEKTPMNPFSARVYLDGKKLKGDRCRGECDGMIKVSLLRTIHGSRHQGECHLEVTLPMTAKVFIPPNGGVSCGFMLPGSMPSMTLAQGAAEPLPAWELELSPQAFVAAGDCLDEHERGSNGHARCLSDAGIQAGAQMAQQ